MRKRSKKKATNFALLSALRQIGAGKRALGIMKLLTHNMLSSRGLRGVKVGFPLKIKVSSNDAVSSLASVSI